MFENWVEALGSVVIFLERNKEKKKYSIARELKHDLFGDGFFFNINEIDFKILSQIWDIVQKLYA